MKNWMRQIELHAAENVNKVLIGNKCDVPEDVRQVSEAEGRALAEQYPNVRFFETSAKANKVGEGAATTTPPRRHATTPPRHHATTPPRHQH